MIYKYLFVLELDDIIVVFDDLIAFVHGLVEELW
jgi:hypothetical protein